VDWALIESIYGSVFLVVLIVDSSCYYYLEEARIGVAVIEHQNCRVILFCEHQISVVDKIVSFVTFSSPREFGFRMMEQEEIKTGGEYVLKEYQVEDPSDTSDMDEEYESGNEQDQYDEFWRQHQKSDLMLELEKQHEEESDIQEALLKSGEYVLLKHGGSHGDRILELSHKGNKAYKQNLNSHPTVQHPVPYNPLQYSAL
jgi:hypothetical protein